MTQNKAGTETRQWWKRMQMSTYREVQRRLFALWEAFNRRRSYWSSFSMILWLEISFFAITRINEVGVHVCFKHFASLFVGYESSRELGTKCLSLGANRLGAKDPWVRNDWIPHVRPFANLKGFLLSLFSFVLIWHDFFCFLCLFVCLFVMFFSSFWFTLPLSSPSKKRCHKGERKTSE